MCPVCPVTHPPLPPSQRKSSCLCQSQIPLGTQWDRRGEFTAMSTVSSYSSSFTPGSTRSPCYVETQAWKHKPSQHKEARGYLPTFVICSHRVSEDRNMSLQQLRKDPTLNCPQSPKASHGSRGAKGGWMGRDPPSGVHICSSYLLIGSLKREVWVQMAG